MGWQFSAVQRDLHVFNLGQMSLSFLIIKKKFSQVVNFNIKYVVETFLSSSTSKEFGSHHSILTSKRPSKLISSSSQIRERYDNTGQTTVPPQIQETRGHRESWLSRTVPGANHHWSGTTAGVWSSDLWLMEYWRLSVDKASRKLQEDPILVEGRTIVRFTSRSSARFQQYIEEKCSCISSQGRRKGTILKYTKCTLFLRRSVLGGTR